MLSHGCGSKSWEISWYMDGKWRFIHQKCGLIGFDYLKIVLLFHGVEIAAPTPRGFQETVLCR